MDLLNFFRTVVTSEAGWFCLAYARIEGEDKETKKTWQERFYSWPDEQPTIINDIREMGTEVDVYFSPYLFTERNSSKEYAIAGRTIVADLDEANVLTIQLKPSVLVETSPDRHQGYWILKDALDAEEHEKLSRKLTYSIPRCDKTGWFLGKKVRVPETYNHKYIMGPQLVRVVDYDPRRYTNQQLDEVSSIAELYGQHAKLVNEEDLDWAETALEQVDSPREILLKVRSSIPTVVTKYSLVAKDRSAALWALYLALFRAGLTRQQVFYVAYYSPNNKFKDLRYGGLRELAKDVLRAELASKIVIPDIKARIAEARKLSMDVQEKSAYIAKVVVEHLEKLGTFYNCIDGTFWYVRDDLGKPVSISTRSEQLLHLLNTIFGLNGAEKETNYTIHTLMAYTSEQPVTAKIGALSHYDHDQRVFILHTGRKDVLVVKDGNINRENNGYGGIVFPWNIGTGAISPHYKALDKQWDDELFGDCLDNVQQLDKQYAKAILKTWLISVFLRDGLNARPILALLGAPGSGKSTLFRRVYTLLYGRERGLNTVTREEDFDYAMAKDPLVVLDNVDTAARWLPDRMAATISPTEVTRRKLFTDGDTYTLRRDAMLGITAHDPKFGRVDVTDRFLLINFERLEHFKPENVILDRIAKLRNALWGAILQDVQTVLNTEMPRTGYPQFRIEDFAQFGFWIATALNIAEDFCAGIRSIYKSQKSFNLEEDMMLVDAIDALLKQTEIKEESAGALWTKLRRMVRDEKGFERRYTNAVSLGRRLHTLLDTLREVYDIEYVFKKNARAWSIKHKIEVGTNAVAT